MSDLLPVLNRLRRRPGMYIGEPSLTKLAGFLLGYDCAHYDLRGGPADPFLVSFQEWIEQRLKIKYVGWEKAILSESGSEAEAFDRFWHLFDEYMARDKSGTEPRINGSVPAAVSTQKESRP